MDILQRRQDGRWRLIEVKSSASMKDEHVEDVAIQYRVVSNCGLDVASCHLATVNRGYVHGGSNIDPWRFFRIRNLTRRVQSLQPKLVFQLRSEFRVLGMDAEPDLPTGKHYVQPIVCEFYDHCKSSLTPFDVELSEDMYIIQRATAEAYLAGKSASTTTSETQPPQPTIEGTPGMPPTKPGSASVPTPSPAGIIRVTWQGDVPPQKWMNFYTKVLSKFATQSGLKIGLNVEIAPEGGVSNQKVDEIKVALRELGLSDTVNIDSK